MQQSSNYYQPQQQAYLIAQQQQQQHASAATAAAAAATAVDPVGTTPLTTVHNINNNEDIEDDSDDDGSKPGSKRSGRRKIKIEYIEDKSRRHITFSKRKAGIMKKAYELSTLTGTQVLLLVVSETGLVYTFTTPKLQPLVTKPEGKNLIQSCLNAPDTMDNTNGPSASMSRMQQPQQQVNKDITSNAGVRTFFN
ncbi:hypothetical protein BDC45DRAFT_449318 [Circinella umbellata]|nr:hypothetical protein BDC45DRAFT_449318 [Circinella umbellata]